MPQITGTLQDATSKVMNGPKGSWTRYDIAIDGKRYQCKQDVFNIAGHRIGETIHADVLSKENGDFTNWYCNAIHAENERGPSDAQERNPENPAAKAMQAQASSQGIVTELAKHESIARMAAVKHLIESGFPGAGSTAFMIAAKALADFYVTGKLPDNAQKADTKEEAQFITEAVIAKADKVAPPDSFDSAAYQDSQIPFMPTSMDSWL